MMPTATVSFGERLVRMFAYPRAGIERANPAPTLPAVTCLMKERRVFLVDSGIRVYDW